MPFAYKFGFQSKLYGLTGARAAWTGTTANGITTGPLPSGLVLLTGGQDSSIDIEQEETDATTKDNAGPVGIEAVIGGLLKFPLKIKLLWDPTSTIQLQMLQAVMQRGIYVPILVLDQPKENAGAFGIWADWAILKFPLNQAIKPLQTIDVEMKPSAYSSVPPQAVIVSAS